MAKFTVDFLEKKNDDWYILNLTDESGAKIDDVSVNRKNKKGEVFPNFDEIMNGGSVEGNLWTSGAGKNYLFAPDKPKTASGGAFKQKLIEETMARKETSISHSQDRKEESIKMSGAQRDAVLIVTTFYKPEDMTDDLIKAKITSWRDWFLSKEFGETIPF